MCMCDKITSKSKWQSKMKKSQSPEVFENSSSIYDFWKAQDLETYIKVFHVFYQINVHCNVLRGYSNLRNSHDNRK